MTTYGRSLLHVLLQLVMAFFLGGGAYLRYAAEGLTWFGALLAVGTVYFAIDGVIGLVRISRRE